MSSDVLESRISDSDIEIRFSDPKLENSSAIRLMLDLLHDRISFPLTTTQLWRLSPLVLLLQRYEMDTPLLQLKKILKKASTDSAIGKIFVFIAAAQFPSMDICSVCIQRGGQETWRDVLREIEDEVEEEVGIERDMRAMSSFDIKSWSERISTKIQGKVMSALWMAEMGMIPKDADDGEEDVRGVEWDVVADRFKASS